MSTLHEKCSYHQQSSDAHNSKAPWITTDRPGWGGIPWTPCPSHLKQCSCSSQSHFQTRGLSGGREEVEKKEANTRAPERTRKWRPDHGEAIVPSVSMAMPVSGCHITLSFLTWFKLSVTWAWHHEGRAAISADEEGKDWSFKPTTSSRMQTDWISVSVCTVSEDCGQLSVSGSPRRQVTVLMEGDSQMIGWHI